MEESVMLVVKAPNQQIEDQMIHCETCWTIKRLKGHLSEVYPSKPRLEDQKLIYSGQLLNDNSILKEVLRTYEGQENHIVHLVCSPPKDSFKPIPSTTSKKDTTSTTASSTSAGPSGGASSNATAGPGLRHRGGQSQTYTWPYNTATATPTAAPVWPMYGTYDAANMAQQMAYMQQAYMQYMTQYMQLMATGNVAAMGTMGMPPMNAVPVANPPPPLREEPQPVNQPAPNQEDPDDPRANRDWLDWLYIMSRMMVLFVIVYFYSSPVRFFVVSTLGIFMYLYHIGFFRAMQRLDQPEEVPETPPPTPDNNNSSDTETPPATPPPPPPVNPLTLTWTAFSSFFLSLIPDQPNVL